MQKKSRFRYCAFVSNVGRTSKSAQKEHVLFLEKLYWRRRSAGVAMSESSREPLEPPGSQRFRTNASPCPVPSLALAYLPNKSGVFCGTCS